MYKKISRIFFNWNPGSTQQRTTFRNRTLAGSSVTNERRIMIRCSTLPLFITGTTKASSTGWAGFVRVTPGIGEVFQAAADFPVCTIQRQREGDLRNVRYTKCLQRAQQKDNMVNYFCKQCVVGIMCGFQGNEGGAHIMLVENGGSRDKPCLFIIDAS